jgi:alkylated DNA repair protein alkB family protein 4
MREPLPLPVFTQVVDFDPECQRAPGLERFSGLRLFQDFVSKPEADALLREIETAAFAPSQSGKQKQHYGPKMNFIKRKMNASGFTGVPDYAHVLEARLRERAGDRALQVALARYQTTDVFVLRYHEEQQSNLDFHTDDAFAYGEVILDLSLESDSVLTFHEPRSNVCVRAEIPSQSLAVLFGAARYEWEHAILATDVCGRRTSITLRTLGDEPRRTEAGRSVLEEALPRCSVS